MGKYKFLLGSFRNSTISSLFTVAEKVKKQSKRKFIILDMLYCSIKYEAAFYDYLEFEFYNLNSKQRSTFLTNGKNNEIVKRFNDKDYWHILDNKQEFNDYFKNYLKRDYLKPNSTKQQFLSFIENKTKIIAKPIDGVGGEGIQIYSTNEPDLYNKTKNALLEEIITQHHDLSKLYVQSVNSIRVFTFFDGKKAYLLQAILKIGNNGIIDNFSSGGMYAFLNEKGTVITPAIDKDDHIYTIHPLSQQHILGFQVPLFDKIIDTALSAAAKIPQIGYIGWDITVNEKEAIIIEGNSYPGVFQIKPRFNKEKTGVLPKYEEIMKIKL